MNKKIFLIKGFSETEQVLEFDRKYVNMYFNFFISNSGGAYLKEEVEILEDITTIELNQRTGNTKLDFAIVVLIGHGATQNDNQLFKLNKNEIIKAGQIELNAYKQLIILESCRAEIEKIDTVNLNNKTPTFKGGGKIKIPIDSEKSRQLYNDQIKKCNDGFVICFACSNNETAKNYYFSHLLIQLASIWHLDTRNRVKTINISELMILVSKEVNEISLKITGESQTPQQVGELDFPFSVSKF